MEVWATLANTALRSSLNREDPNLAAPSAGVYTYTIHVTFACTYMHVHKYEHYKEINMLVCTCAVYVYTCTWDLHPSSKAVPTVIMVPSGVERSGSLLK